MARVKLSEAFKDAISRLPAKEKDKLLFRLLPKEPALVEQLAFQLLDNGDTTEERRDELQEQIGQAIAYVARQFYSPGYLLLDLRSLSGEINRHVKTTKDKYGEIALNFYLLNKTLELCGEQVKWFPGHKSRTFNEYVVGRALKLLKLLGKIHEDYQMDFQDDIQQLGRHIEKQPEMMKVAVNQGLNVKWLLTGEISDDFR